jgi:hypothetical protein
MKRILIPVAVILLAAGLAWRIGMFNIGTHALPAFDDECKISLQAKQIAQGARPLMILASPYLFPLDAYLMAPFINLLPRNAFGARIMSFGFGILTVILSLLVIRRMGPWKDVWPGIVLVLFPSGYLLMLQVGCALPGYPILMLLAAFVVWVAQRHAEAQRLLWLLALLGGVAGGLVASDTMLALPILVMGGAMIAVARNWRSAIVSAPAFGIGALIGLTPHVLATHGGGQAFSAVEKSVPWREAVGKITDAALSSALPAACGWRPPIFPDNQERVSWILGLDLYVGIAFVVLLAVLTAVVLWLFIRRLQSERWPRMDVGLVFVGIAWMCLVLFIFSFRSHSHTYRYFIPFVWTLPFLIAYAYARSGVVGRSILGIVTILLAAMNIIGSFKIMQRWASPGYAEYLKCYDMKPAFDYLDKRGINRCYATYVDAYRVTFETDERIICSQPYNERFPGWPVPFKDLVDASTNVAFVLADAYRLPPEEFEQDLATMKVKYRKEACGHYQVFTDFEPTLPPPGTPVPSASLVITTSHYQQEAHLLNDGDYLSRWRSHGSQEKGMWIEIRMPERKTVSQLALYYNLYRFDRAKTMRLQAYKGKQWVTVQDGIPSTLDCFDIVNGHPSYINNIQIIRFPDVKTDRLRLEIIEPEPGRDWTIGEIRVFEAN